MPADILLYALFAAGLVFWLRSILGTRNGDERQRPNPFASNPEPQQPAANQPALAAPENALNLTPGEAIIGGPLTLPKSSVGSIANVALEPTLLDIARQDRGFTLAHFIGGAQDAFVMIIEAFASGDRDLLKSLLAPDLFKAFDQALSDRAAAGEVMTAEIHAIRKVEVIDAQIKDKMCFITLRFVADETVVTRDADGKVVTGNPDRVRETIDIWTLGRQMTSKDPTWYLFATRDEDSPQAPTLPETKPN